MTDDASAIILARKTGTLINISLTVNSKVAIHTCTCVHVDPILWWQSHIGFSLSEYCGVLTVQVPPFWQGPDEHSSMFLSHVSPS